MRKITIILGLLYLFVMSACTPSARIARIAKKYNLKQYEEIVFRDTLYIEENTYIFDTQIDTAGAFHQQHIDSEVFGYVRDSIVHIEFITKADTVYISKPIEIETIKVETVQKSKIPLWFLIFFAGTVIVMWLFYVFRDKQSSK